MNPDASAERVYRALQEGRFEAALEAAEQVMGSIDDRPLLQARLLAWKGQAWMGLNQPEKAQSSILRGLSLARKAGDTDGVEALRGLHRSVVARLAAQQRPATHTPTPLTQSLEAFDQGNQESGVELAQMALKKAQTENDPREQVLALLALARSSTHARDAVFQAHEIAQDSGDPNLVSAVARAAKAANIALPAHVF